MVQTRPGDGDRFGINRSRLWGGFFVCTERFIPSFSGGARAHFGDQVSFRAALRALACLIWSPVHHMLFRIQFKDFGVTLKHSMVNSFSAVMQRPPPTKMLRTQLRNRFHNSSMRRQAPELLPNDQHAGQSIWPTPGDGRAIRLLSEVHKMLTSWFWLIHLPTESVVDKT